MDRGPAYVARRYRATGGPTRKNRPTLHLPPLLQAQPQSKLARTYYNLEHTSQSAFVTPCDGRSLRTSGTMGMQAQGENSSPSAGEYSRTFVRVQEEKSRRFKIGGFFSDV